MRTKDIKPGEFYGIRLAGRDSDVARVEGFAEPRWDGDTATVRATRFLAGGTLLIPLRPKDVLTRVTPDKPLLAVMRLSEKRGPMRAEARGEIGEIRWEA